MRRWSLRVGSYTAVACVQHVVPFPCAVAALTRVPVVVLLCCARVPGGYGFVYLAHDTTTHKTMVLKKMLAGVRIARRAA